MEGEEEKADYLTWHDFSQEASMHGIRYVHMTNISMVRRVLWGLFTTAMIAYFFYGTYSLVDVYSRRLITTKIQLKNTDNIQFPTVTICNRNYWKATTVERVNDTEEVNTNRRELIADIYAPNRPDPPADKYDWSSEVLDEMIQANDPFTEDGVTGFLGSMAHTLNETIIICWVSSKMVPCHTIFTTVKTDAGYCFRYNGDGSVISSVSGSQGGLVLVLDAVVDEYYVGPVSYSEGFAVALHDKDDVPIVNGLSYAAGVTADTYMIVNRKETSRVPPPADDKKADCYDTLKKPNTLHYYQNYTLNGCKIECKAAYILKMCGCRSFLMPPLNDTNSCSIKDQLLCVKPSLEEFRSNPEHLNECHCRSPCDDIKYSATTSSLKFPSLNFAKTNDFSNETIEQMKRSWCMLSIYYGDMSYQSVEESLAIATEDLVASFGGTMGVCFGGSLLTLIEFGEFAIMALTRFLCKRKNNNRNRSVTPVKKFES